MIKKIEAAKVKPFCRITVSLKRHNMFYFIYCDIRFLFIFVALFAI